jgi:hypothetical protein
MYNNNLAAPQRKFETWIFLWKSRHDGRLVGSSGAKLIREHKVSAWFFSSIYRETDVFFQQKIRGASEKFKNQLLPLIRPRSVQFRQHFWNLSHETVPLRAQHVLIWAKSVANINNSHPPVIFVYFLEQLHCPKNVETKIMLLELMQYRM